MLGLKGDLGERVPLIFKKKLFMRISYDDYHNIPIKNPFEYSGIHIFFTLFPTIFPPIQASLVRRRYINIR